MAPLPLRPLTIPDADFTIEPQPWPGDKSLRHLSIELLAENPLQGVKPDDEPEAAGPAFAELPAADRLPKSTVELDPSWTAQALRLPDASRPAVRAGAPRLCRATSGLLAEAVEAFIPPGRQPDMLAYSAACSAPVPWPLQSVDWKVSVDMASPAVAPSSQPVEALLPPFAEPQSIAWATATALPQLTIDTADWLAAAALAERVAGPSSQPVESLLPPFAELQSIAWPALPALPQFTIDAADWLAATALAERVAAPAAQPVEALLPPFAEPQSIAWPALPALPQLSIDTADWLAATFTAEVVAGPSAQPVEALLPQFAEPQSIAWPAFPALPQLTIDTADWMAATDPAVPVAGPSAQPVETLIPPFAEPESIAWPALPALPRMAIELAEWLAADATAMAEPVAGPAAQPVESFLPSPAESQIAPWPATVSTLPRLTLNAATWVLSVDVVGPVPAAAAEAVESFLPALPEPQIVQWPAAATTLPSLTVDPAAWVVAVGLMEPAAAAFAEPVESFLPPFAEPQIVSWPATAAQLPRLRVQAADWVLTADIAEAATSPAAQAVESLLPAAIEPSALPIFQREVRLPEFALAAIMPEPVEEFVPPLLIADACQDWMPSLPACEAVREVVPSFGGALPTQVSVQAPVELSLHEPAIRWEGDWRPAAMAEPVISFVAPHLESALSGILPVAAPEAGALQRPAAGQHKNLAAPAGRRLPEIVGPVTDSRLVAAAYQQSGRAGHALRLPDFALEHTTGNRTAPFRPAVPSALQPASAEPNPGGDATRLNTAAALQSPAAPAALLRCGFPLAKAASTDFICQRTPMAPVKSLESIAPKVVLRAPKFVVRPIFERLEEAVAPLKPVEKTPAFAEIFEMSKALRKPSASRSGLFSAGKLIAASLIVGLGMWFGFGSVKISRQLFALNTNIHGIGSNNTSSGIDTGSSAPARYASAKTEGPIARVRHAIQNRASVELTDTFRRMEAWGSNAMTLPAGWTRNSDGYVRTGQLALYRPAQSFSDYHFEFFGEIEKKSMSWAVRAHDPQNYYGMKMTVIEPGLRPVVAMVHYAVVGGKKGQRVETPLSIMVHNNEPYHIAVDVNGNKVVTSVEGQEVDSWTADAIKVGGIGFFSEMGESAKLYWLRLSKNQDWLGRVCAYLSSGSRNETADLWRDEIPQAPAQPSQPAPPPATDLTVAEETEEYSHISPQRARISKYGRTEICRS